MDKHTKRLLLVMLFALQSIAVFAQKKPLSANGVKVSEWMANCHLLYSESFWGDNGRSIYQLFSSPSENTKITRITVKDSRVKLESEKTDGNGNTLFLLTVEFVCHKMNNGGTCYTSYVRFGSPITFQDTKVDCFGPDDGRKYGQCLGMLYELCTGPMFTDEIIAAHNKAQEEERFRKQAEEEAAEKKRQEQLAKEQEEKLRAQKVEQERIAKEKAEKAVRDKKRQEQLAKEQEEKLRAQKVEQERIAREKAEKAARDKKRDDAFVEDFAGRQGNGYLSDELADFGGIVTDSFDDTDYNIRLYAIANRASIKAEYAPVYYQGTGNRNYDPEKWTTYPSYGQNQSSIETDDSADGFVIVGKTKDSLKLAKRDFAHKQTAEAERKELRDKKDEALVREVINKRIRNEYRDSGKIDYGEFHTNFSADEYGNYQGTVKDTARVYSILNKASVQAGFSPCYYQYIEEERIYDSGRWNLVNWNSGKGQWANANEIKIDGNANGFRFSEPWTLYRMDSTYFTKKEEEAKAARLEREKAASEQREERNKAEDENYVGKVLALRVERKSDKKYEYEQISLPSDDFRKWAILNRASEKAGYAPVYYQEQDGSNVFDPELWIKEWDSNRREYSNKDSIKESSEADGYRLDSKGFTNCILCRKNFKTGASNTKSNSNTSFGNDKANPKDALKKGMEGLKGLIP